MKAPALWPALLPAGFACVLSAAPFRVIQPDPEPVSFTDVTAASGITFKHAFAPEKQYILESMSGGVGIIDFDRDGRPDLYFVNAPTVATAATPRSARSELWKNNGDGTYTDVTEKAGVGDPGWGMGVAAGDYDNDGWDDLYVTCFGPDRLYRNNHDGTFSDVTEKAGVSDPRWSTGAAFADYDNDGRLDLFVANYVDLRLDALPAFGKGKTCQFQGLPVQCGPRGLPGSGDSLFHNNGDGTFTDVARAAGVADPSGRFGMGVVWCDFNDDGYADLYVANDTGPNYLYRNNGNGTFTDVGLASGTALSENGEARASMGVTVGDVRPPRPMEHLRHELLRRVQRVLPADQGLPVHGRVVCHADGESRACPTSGGAPASSTTTTTAGSICSWPTATSIRKSTAPDSQTTYRQRKLLYRNRRDGTFSESGQNSGSALSAPGASRGAAFGDLDNDGDLDVVISDLDGAPTLLRNDGGNRHNFLMIDLVGTEVEPPRARRARDGYFGRSRPDRRATERRQLPVTERHATAFRPGETHQRRRGPGALARRRDPGAHQCPGERFHHDHRRRAGVAGGAAEMTALAASRGLGRRRTRAAGWCSRTPHKARSTGRWDSWTTPAGRRIRACGCLNAVLGDWQVAPLVRWQSGSPFSVTAAERSGREPDVQGGGAVAAVPLGGVQRAEPRELQQSDLRVEHHQLRPHSLGGRPENHAVRLQVRLLICRIPEAGRQPAWVDAAVRLDYCPHP